MLGVFYNEEFKKEILESYQKISSTYEFCSLLNRINSTYDTSIAKKKITPKLLYYLIKKKDTKYEEYKILKKNGALRTILAPDEYLKHTQYLINILLQIVFENKVNHFTNGFLINRNIVRNATPHINKKYVLNIDIKDFFPSIPFRRIKKTLEFQPFDLQMAREEIGFVIANIATYKGFLPQGAPTSPILSNIVTQKLDRKIESICKEENIKFSRYADDLTFSSNKNVLTETFVNKVYSIIKEEGFMPNDQKTRLRSKGQRQEVTGVIVNDKLNISRQYIKKIRSILYNWEKKGEEYTQRKFLSFYEKKTITPNFKDVLWGYISFMGLVRGKEDLLYKRYASKFHLLRNRIDYYNIDNKDVNEQLIKDNIKMELLFFNDQKSRLNFEKFCTLAFFQIENILYFFFHKRFPDIQNLFQYLYENNPDIEKQYKKKVNEKKGNIKEANPYSKIRDIKIYHLVYLYEKEFYFDKKISYKQEVTFIRDIRNDYVHRNMINTIDQEAIKKKYQELLITEKVFFNKNKKNRIRQSHENELDKNYRYLEFIEQKNYKHVRSVLCKVFDDIQNYKYDNN